MFSTSNNETDGPQKCLLLVENDPDLQVLFRLQIELCYGHRVIEAADQVLTIDLAIKEKPILILLDLKIPNAFELISALHQNPETSSIPIVAYTNEYWDLDVKRKVLSYGAIGCIDKLAVKDQVEQFLKKIC